MPGKYWKDYETETLIFNEFSLKTQKFGKVPFWGFRGLTAFYTGLMNF